MKSRIFRVLVCLLVICALVINISPIRAKAVAVDPVTAVSALGIILLVYMMMAGFVAIPATVETVNQLDRGFTKKMEDLLGDDDEKWAEFQAYSKQVNDQFFGGDDFPDPDYTSFYVGQTLAALISGWIAGGIKEGCVALLDAAEADPGYAWYNDYYLPEIPASFSDYPYFLLLASEELDTFMLYGCTMRVTALYGDGYISYPVVEGGSYSYCYYYPGSSTSWGSFVTDKTVASGYNLTSSSFHPVWTNFDLYDYKDKTLLHIPASELSYHDYVVTELPADAILGEVAQGIQNGTHTEDDLVLPATIDLSQVVSSPETALQEIQSTAQQLADGTITLDQFLEKVQIEESTEPDETTPSTSPEETTPSDQPVPDTSTINDYALDLTEFFPFCIPFDIYEFLSLLAAEPEAPKFDFKFNFGEHLGVHTLTIDLSPWDGTAQLLRRLELLLFIVGLAMATRNYYTRG